MRIRKRPVSQCGASLNASIRPAGRQYWGIPQPAGGKQFMLYTTTATTFTSEEEFSESRLGASNHGINITPAPTAKGVAGSYTETCLSSVPELGNSGPPVQYDRKALLLQQLQVHKQSAARGISSDAAYPYLHDVERNIVLLPRPPPSTASSQRLPVDVGLDCTSTTTRLEAVSLLETAGTVCLPVAAALHDGQVAEQPEKHFQIGLDKRIVGSSPLPNMDHDRNLKKQPSTRVIRDNAVKASKDDGFWANENTSRSEYKFFLPEAMDDLDEQEGCIETFTSDGDAQQGKEDNKVPGALDWGMEDYLRCGRRSGRGWQCKNKRTKGGGSLFCDYHQSKITRHRSAWINRKKATKENKILNRQSSWQRRNMVDVKVLELPLFPSKQIMYGNLQAQDKVSSEGVAMFETRSKAARYTKVQRESSIHCTDDLDLKLAPTSEALPSLVETDLTTKLACPELSENIMESPILENFSLKRRKIAGATASQMRAEMTEHGHPLTEVNIICAGQEHLNTIRVFRSSSRIMQQNTMRNETSGMSRNVSNCTISRDNQGFRDVGLVTSSQKVKSALPDSTADQELLMQNGPNFDLQQVPSRQSSCLLTKEQEINTICAQVEVSEHWQQHRCKRHDGRDWRCKNICAPGKFYCERHARKQPNYISNQFIKPENRANVHELQQTIADGKMQPESISDNVEDEAHTVKQLHVVDGDEHERRKGKSLLQEFVIDAEPKLQVIKKGLQDRQMRRERLNAIRVFKSSASIKRENALRNESSSLSRNVAISIIKDHNQDVRDVGLVKSLPKSTMDQKLSVQRANLPFRESNLLAKQDGMNALSAQVEWNEQGQQQRCKRHDGRDWQCKRICVPGKFYCEHHAKKQRNYANQVIKAENRTCAQYELQQTTIADDEKRPESSHNVEDEINLLKQLHQELEEHEQSEKKGLVQESAPIEPEPLKLQVEKRILDKQLYNAGQDYRMERVRVGAAQKRCGRHDGRGWQCKSACMPGSVYCEHHKEKLRKNHAKWNANCVMKRQQLHGSGRCSELQQRKTSGASNTKKAEQGTDRTTRKGNSKGITLPTACKAVQSKTAIDAASTKKQPETAEDDNDDDAGDRKEKQRRVAEPDDDDVVEAPPSAPRKRKRRFLHHIYARCTQ
ncbi:hypothetical protein GOP47_0018840 [Adiantum capillus-veneris]|uniref:WRC domain-containing protein n=1 Tax=Adiantum capillus-veneris TaxID=13818 RepID=A0A9D4UE03_ADICA|nr:hypothetical protein GOP47_0018840 [Adiantum capillus-veneris]